MSKNTRVPKVQFDVLIVGAGAAGLGAADAFSSRGLTVAVVSRRDDRGEASPRAAGILDPLLEQNKKSPLIPAAIEAFHQFPAFLKRLKRATGSDAAYKRTGMIYLAVSPSEKRELEKRFLWQKKWMPSIRLMGSDEVRRKFPQAHPRVLAGLHYPQVGKINAPEFMKIFKRCLSGRGVRFFATSDVVQISKAEKGKSFLVQAGSRIFAAGKVVNAAGAWASDTRLLGQKLPVAPVRGQMLTLKGEKSFPVIFHSLTGGYIVPWEKGVHLAGSTVEREGFNDQVTAEGRESILTNVGRVCPEALEMKEIGAWAGLRPCSADNVPVLGAVPGSEGYYAATGYFRSGILLSAFLGELLAEFALTGRIHPLMRPFLPRRFQTKS